MYRHIPSTCYAAVLANTIWIWIFISVVVAVIDELRVDIVVDVTKCPQQAEKGDTLLLYYNGTFESGVSFDATTPGSPINLTLGPALIAGFNQGLYGACANQTRRIFVPHSLGYGEAGAGNGTIPPNTDIIFLVEVLAIFRPDPSSAVQADEKYIVTYENATELVIDGNFTATTSIYPDDIDGDGNRNQDGDTDGDRPNRGNDDDDHHVTMKKHGKPFWWYLQFLAIPVLIILLVVDAYYLYKIYFPHGRVKFYKVRDQEPNDIVNTL